MLQPQHCRSMDNAQLPLPSSASSLLESSSSKSHLILPPKNDLESWSQAEQLITRVSQHILAEDSAVCREHLTSLRVHGQVFHMDCDLSYWSEAVSSLPDHEMRFNVEMTYNAAIDTLPTNANLALWYQGQVSAQCKLCGFPTQI